MLKSEFFKKLKFQSAFICYEKILTKDLEKCWHFASVLDLDVYCFLMLKRFNYQIQITTQLIPHHHFELAGGTE